MGPAWGPMGPYGPNVATELEAALAADLSGVSPLLVGRKPPWAQEVGINAGLADNGGEQPKKY